MGYAQIDRRLRQRGIVILDGGTGTELERRGVPMNPEAWCGAASLEHGEVLEAVHRDYIAAGADVITANTYASSRLMLEAAGLGDRFDLLNRSAVEIARRARDAAGRNDVLVAGSLSSMLPMQQGAAATDLTRAPSYQRMLDAFAELAGLHKDAGCDLIILEMMYHPERMHAAFTAATATGLPVWAGFSARRGDDGSIQSFAPDRDIAFGETVSILKEFDVAAAGIMHTPADIIGDCIRILDAHYGGPLMAYPDSGHFKMPHWQFEDVMTPDDLHGYALDWIEEGVRIIGGCCGLSPEHIAALAPLKRPVAA